MATLQISAIRHATLWGIDIHAETAAHNFNLTRRDDGLVEGRWPANANEAAVGIAFAGRTGLHIGDRIPLRTTSAQFSDRMWSPVITGIFSFDFYFDQSVIITDFERLQRLLALGEGTQQLVIFADNDRLSPLIASEVQNLLGENSVVTDWNDNYFVAMQRASSRIYYIAYAALLILASFLIISTMVMIIHERIKEIGMMGSLGMTRAEVVKVFFFESVFLSCFGALCGVILGGTLTAILSHFPIRMGAEGFYGDMPMSNTIFFQFSFARLITAWIAGVVLTSIITLIPSLKSAFIEPVEALRR
jgi:putative ABC transport system permease protein